MTEERNTPREIAFDMEGDVGTVRDYGKILVLMAGGFTDQDHMDAVARVGYALIDLSANIEADRMRVLSGINALCHAK